jgi:signal transduction histidine kinase/DNA-binding NarL/FixJ family response regulator
MAGFDEKGPVWSMARDGGGRVFLGTDRLLVLDGRRCARIGIPGAHAFRALASDGSRIFVGAIGAVGYVDPDGAGGYRFTSLAPALRAAGADEPGEIWHAQAVPGGAVFVSDDRVFRVRTDGVGAPVAEAWTLPCRQRLLAFALGADVWVFQAGRGLLRLEKEGPRLVWAAKDLPGEVLWMASTAGGPLLGTIEGAFRLDGARWTRLPAASAALADKLAVGAAVMGDGTVAVGTYLNGIVMFTPDDSRVAVIDRRSGLKDDSVQALWPGAGRELWAGLATGFACVVPPWDASRFGAESGYPGGPFVRILRDGVDSVVVTPRAVLGLVSPGGDPSRASVEAFPDVGGLVRDAANMGGRPWVAGYGGIWQWENGAWARELYVSADIYRIAPSALLQRCLYYIEGYSVRALIDTPRGWASRDLGQNVGDTPTGLLEDASGDLWVSTETNGVFRFHVETADGRPTRLQLAAQFYPGHGLPAGGAGNALAAAGGDMYVFGDQGILGRLREGFGFEPVPELGPFLGIASAGDYWLVKRRDLPAVGVIRVLPRSREGKLRWEPVDVPGIDDIGAVSSIALSSPGPAAGHDRPAPQPALWVGGADAMIRCSPGGDGDLPVPTVNLEASVDSGIRDFAFSSPSAISESAIFYQTRLEPAERDWTAPGTNAERNLPGLGRGAYSFEARALDRWGRPGPPESLAFSVPAPWYADWPALAAYAALAAGGAWGAVRWRIRRLKVQNERLNRLVEDRTRELAMANTAKADFLANISHEIRNPLNGIVGLVAILGRSKLPAEDKELANSLGACVRTLTRVFDEVLNFSRLEFGRVALQVQPFPVDALMREVADLFALPARQAGCSLAVVASGEPRDGAAASRGGAFLGDPDKIKTILGNFVANAIKYAPGSPIEISCDHSVASSPASLTFSVSDRGPGIPADEQELIFRKFVRGGSARTLREPGAGLGLATCKALAELMGGGVNVDSVPGKGATFSLHLFLEPSDRVVPGVPPPEEAEPWLKSETGRALVVEDQDYNQIVIRRIAERLGFTPEVAGNATVAMARIAEAPFAVVFLDWDLPGMKGNELARWIRSADRGSETIILAATAHDSDAIRRQCLEAGMDGFVLKPFDESMVAAVLADVRQRRAAAQPSRGEELNLGMFRYVGHDDPERSARAAEDYRRILDSELAALGEAVASGHAEGIAHHAHRLMSHANVIRARGLNEAAHAMEVRAATAGGVELRDLLETIRARAAVLQDEIGAAIRTPSGGSA